MDKVTVDDKAQTDNTFSVESQCHCQKGVTDKKGFLWQGFETFYCFPKGEEHRERKQRISQNMLCLDISFSCHLRIFIISLIPNTSFPAK